jgi:shikimate dehydrogenase
MKRALVGLIGANIGKSLSPALHEDAFEAAGIRGHYHLMELSRGRSLLGLLNGARMMGFLGVNITYPCKEAVLPLLDVVSAEGQEIGAVNTVTISADGEMTGYNTDRSGFRRSFEENFGRAAVEGKTALLVGAGGAGRAVAFALFDLGLKTLLVHDVDPARAGALAGSLAHHLGDPESCREVADPEAALPECAGVVNATPVGMLGMPGIPVPVTAIGPGHFVADVIYTPLETELVVAARAKGARATGGAGMCVYQAADAFRLFTGLEPDTARMHRTFAAAARVREAALAGAAALSADTARSSD